MHRLSDFKFKENLLLKELLLLKFESFVEDRDYILGNPVSKFEESFSSYCGVNFSIGVSSGTSALKLALSCLDLKAGDEVIIPAHTFISTALAVLDTGAKLVLCDINPKTFNIDPEELEKKISKNTKVIIPVHLYGQMVDMRKIKELAGNTISIVEDASQAHGAHQKIDNLLYKSGSVGQINCFSLYPTKNLGAMGDAGIITTNNEEYSKILKALRNYGQYAKSEHVLLGSNERLDTLQAIVLEEKLKLLDEYNQKRKLAAAWYNEILSNTNLEIPYVEENNNHVFHQYVIQVSNREKVLRFMNSKNIELGIHYPKPIHLHSCFKHLGYKHGDFPISEEVCSNILSLPIAPYIQQDDIEIISNYLKTAVG